jgi:hypothetical protein
MVANTFTHSENQFSLCMFACLHSQFVDLPTITSPSTLPPHPSNFPKVLGGLTSFMPVGMPQNCLQKSQFPSSFSVLHSWAPKWMLLVLLLFPTSYLQIRKRSEVLISIFLFSFLGISSHLYYKLSTEICKCHTYGICIHACIHSNPYMHMHIYLKKIAIL